MVFSSTFYAGLTTAMFGKTILEMVGDEHRRYRGAVQPAFSPKRAQWWIDQWITTLVDEAISAIEHDGERRAQHRALRPHPAPDHHRQLRPHRDEAFEFREGAEGDPHARPASIRRRPQRARSARRRCSTG